MQNRRWFLRALEKAGQLDLASVELGTALLHHVDRHGVLEIQIHNLLKLVLDPLHLGPRRIDCRPTFQSQPVHLPGELLAELLEQRRIHQVVAQRVQDARLNLVAPDVAAPAAAALRQPGKQVFRPPAFPELVLGPGVGPVVLEALPPRFGRLPKIVVEKAQLRQMRS